MQCGKVIDIIEAEWKREDACDWDNVGLLVGSRKIQVHKIMLALDATDDVIRQTIDSGADMLITHHPMIFHGMKSVTMDDFVGRRVLALAQNKISYYAMHTNFDVNGMGEAAAKRLGMTDCHVLEYTGTREEKELGIGEVGHLAKQMTLQECAELVKRSFGLQSVRFFGDAGQQVCKVAVSPGSGKSEIATAIAAGVQVLITGDIDHHDGIDAVAQGLSVIDAGHYGLEHIFSEYMSAYLNCHLEGVEVLTAEEQEPFCVV